MDIKNTKIFYCRKFAYSQESCDKQCDYCRYEVRNRQFETKLFIIKQNEKDMVIVKDNIGRPLYNYTHDGNYWDLNGNKITKETALSITYEYYSLK